MFNSTEQEDVVVKIYIYLYCVSDGFDKTS